MAEELPGYQGESPGQGLFFYIETLGSTSDGGYRSVTGVWLTPEEVSMVTGIRSSINNTDMNVCIPRKKDSQTMDMTALDSLRRESERGIAIIGSKEPIRFVYTGRKRYTEGQVLDEIPGFFITHEEFMKRREEERRRGAE